MNLLESIDRIIKENFELQSRSYNSNDQTCFVILLNDNQIGTVRFNLLDGSPVNIYSDKPDYKLIKPVIAVEVSNFSSFKEWIISELVSMGYKFNPVVINDSEYPIDKTDVDLEVESLKSFLKLKY